MSDVLPGSEPRPEPTRTTLPGLLLFMDDVKGDGPCDELDCITCGKRPTYRFYWRQTPDWGSSFWLCLECGRKQAGPIKRSGPNGDQEILPPAVLAQHFPHLRVAPPQPEAEA